MHQLFLLLRSQFNIKIDWCQSLLFSVFRVTAAAATPNITCYECKSCQNPFNPSDKNEVLQTDGCAGCVKVRINGGHGFKYGRLCVPGTYASCETYIYTKGFEERVKLFNPEAQSKLSPSESYCCSTDLCNGAISMLSKLSWFFPVVGFSLLLSL